MQEFNHHCPYCGTQLSVKEIEEERTAAKCPHCANTIILLEHGAVMKKPIVYRCPKCNEELIYEQRPPFAHCDNCRSVYLTSEQGNCLIDPDLYNKGEKGELPFVKKKDNVVALKNKWRMMPVRTKGGIAAGIACAILILIGIYIFTLPPAIEKSKAYADMENIWKEFREKNPYNIQIEGLKSYDDNSYVAIISEPNENVTEKELNKFFKSYNCSFKTFKKKIGYDGWLRDAVVCFNDLDKDDIPIFSRKLSKLLYGTDYKAGLMDFDVIPEHTPFSTYDLNFQVTEEELRKWFVEDKEPLVNLEDTTKITNLIELFNTDKTDTQVYLSKQPGFVVWFMNIGDSDYKEFRVAARKFAIDSDLIFGAIATTDKVAIIARERCVPIYELPPMREETLRLLASTEEDELAQSYERTSLFAGKLPGGKDFAPIYLSDELWHTEYGNTLNVTDQMLKSWSENGMIDYIDFDYPKPVNWTFDNGVTGDLGVSQLTYNWNTAGVGYIVEDGAYSIYALNRTGSLPVSYIPGESEGISDNDPVYQAEQKAYDFFSNLSSPELVKVVQYAAMYQIFKNIGITVKAKKREEYKDNIMVVPDSLKSAANNIIQSLARFSLDDKKKIAEYYDAVLLTESELQSYPKYRGFPVDDSHRICKMVSNVDDSLKLHQCADTYFALDSVHQALLPLSRDYTLMGCLGAYIIDRNGTDLQYSSDAKQRYESGLPNLPSLNTILGTQTRQPTTSYEDIITYAINKIGNKSFEIQRYIFMIGTIDITHSKTMYLDANRDKCLTWMKCPTIVESWQLKDSTNAVGGHNLNSKVTSFRVAKDLKPGQTRTIELNGKKIIEVSSKDRMTHVSDPNYLRRVGRLGNSEIKGGEIPLRAKTEVVGLARQRSARGFNTEDHLAIKLDVNLGHSINGKKYTNLEELLKDASASLEDGRAQFKQIEIDGLKDAGVDVDVFIDGVVGKMRKGSCTNIPMSKYDFAHYSVKYEGEKAIVTIPIKAGSIEFGSTSNVIQAGLGGSSNFKPSIKIKGGEVTFKVPKSKLQEFLAMIQEFLTKQKGNWNEFKIKMEMKRRGINPADCEERTRLKVAKVYYNLKIGRRDVWTIQEEAVA